MQVVISDDAIKKAVQQQYFKKSEAANFCGISSTTFNSWRKVNPIPSIVVEGQVLFSKNDLVEFMEAHRR